MNTWLSVDFKRFYSYSCEHIHLPKKYSNFHFSPFSLFWKTSPIVRSVLPIYIAYTHTRTHTCAHTHTRTQMYAHVCTHRHREFPNIHKHIFKFCIRHFRHRIYPNRVDSHSKTWLALVFSASPKFLHRLLNCLWSILIVFLAHHTRRFRHDQWCRAVVENTTK